MGSQIRVPRTETEVPINLTVTAGGTGPVSGATAVYAIRDGDTPDSWLDFNDSTFKTAGWTTRQASLTGSGTQAGLYTAVPGLDLSAITNLPAATRHLLVEYEVTAPAANAGIVSDVILIDDPVDGLAAIHGAGSWATAVGFAVAGDAMALTAAAVDAIWDELQAGHITPGTFGFFLDAQVSTATPTASAATIAAAVWDENAESHTSPATTGKYLRDTYGATNGPWEIDFTGTPTGNWQRVQYRPGGVTELFRHDLLESGGAGDPGTKIPTSTTVPAFINNRQMVTSQEEV